MIKGKIIKPIEKLEIEIRKGNKFIPDQTIKGIITRTFKNNP